MIRLIYWFTILIELLLVLLILFIFLITDARTVKLLAKESLESSSFSYKSIEGNFFRGLEIKALAYKKKPLFDSATLHWNPISILNKKITLQEVDIRGVDIDNILDVVEDFSSSKESKPIGFDFSIILNRVHLDIKPYKFEGVKFSNFIFETDRVSLSKDFKMDTSNIILDFDSDLVGVKLRGNIKKNRLFVDTLSLKEIDSKVITMLVKRLQKKSVNIKTKDKKRVNPFIKKIKIKKIVATMRDVTYNPITISKTKVNISDAEIDPSHQYNYRAKKVKLQGDTNFGDINYSGYIENSAIYAKGDIHLSKELFKKYSLPLNYSTLNTLHGSLKLNHYGVWIDATHSSSAKLLKIDSDFNINLLKARHKLHYDYSDNNLTIISTLIGKMPYSDRFNINSSVVIDEKIGFRYSGDIDIPKVKGLPKEISDYLLEGLKGEYRGTSSSFDSRLSSKLLEGRFKIDNYKTALLELDSRGESIELDRLTKALPPRLKKSRASLRSKTFFDFKNFRQSTIKIEVISKLLNIDVDMNLYKPFYIDINSTIPYNSILPRLYPDIKFDSLSELKGKLSISNREYSMRLKSRYMRLSLFYDPINQIVKKAQLLSNSNRFAIKSLKDNRVELKSESLDINRLLKSISKHYRVKLPKIYGQLNLDILQNSKDSFDIRIQSKKIRYESINIYDIEMKFSVDKKGNVEIDSYKFRVDENGYMSRFYSNKKLYLTFIDNKISIKEFWINNQLLLSGLYDIADSKGDFNLKAKQFSYINRDFDFLVDLDLDAKIDKERIRVSGDIDIFGNLISYEVVGSDIVEDSDIIILQDKKDKSNSILDNLSLDIKINSKKPLKYISKDTNIEFFNDLSILKKYNSDILVTGMSTVSKGYYQLEDNYFTLDESHIYFAGDPKKPQLDIKANYKKDEYTIQIFISGTPDEPIVNFTAEPYLTQQEILSLILFDGTRRGDGYTLLGGTFAKGLMRSLGIDVDHLLLGSDENDNISFEIGQKISKKITVIYQHQNGRDGVKARIEHSKSFETDIVIQPPNSSSVEFLYKHSN